MSRLGQIKQTFKSVRIEIKAFLRRQQWKEALIFFCFILLAFGFWLLQSLQNGYSRQVSGGPGNLKIIATGKCIQIQHLAAEIQPLHKF
mgnify:CR=1 FL=1